MLREVARAVVPSAVRRRHFERQLRRQHGLVATGSVEPQRISASTRFGRNCRVNGPVFIMDSEIGDYTYLEAGCRLLRVDMGSFGAVAPLAQVGLAEHPTDRWVSGHPAFYQLNPRFGYDFLDVTRHEDLPRTAVGNDVWVGSAACVRSGVVIGDGAVVAAGAVVVSDVPPFAIVGGVPARVIRYRFDPEEIEFLLSLRWWDRSEAWLREHAHLMDDVSRLREVVAVQKR